MSRELLTALTVFVLLIAGFAVYLCKLAWSGLKRPPGQLSEQWEPDQERSREHRMKGRNEP